MNNIIEIKSIYTININEFYGSNSLSSNKYKNKSDMYKVLLIDQDYSDYLFKEIYDLQLQGYITIVLYPEKLTEIFNNIDEINKFLDAGCFFILDAKSLEGDYGRSIKNTAKYLLKNNIYNFILKNHVSEDRLNSKIKNIDKLKEKLISNLECLVNDEVIEQSNRRIKKKKLLGIF